MNRRGFLILLSGIGALAATAAVTGAKFALAAAEKIGKITKTPEEWKKILTADQYAILREEATERPGSSPLLNEHRAGSFACIGCGLELFSSATKFDSGTGWPSFFDHLPDALEMKTDHKLIVARTEYHCARCGGHHGHVFKDGPKPTGLRYCNNGAVLKFIPEKA
jgi:peptide-methionine (R)-S-oxide reductase